MKITTLLEQREMKSCAIVIKPTDKGLGMYIGYLGHAGEELVFGTNNLGKVNPIGYVDELVYEMEAKGKKEGFLPLINSVVVYKNDERKVLKGDGSGDLKGRVKSAVRFLKEAAAPLNSAYDLVLRQTPDGISMYVAPWGDIEREIAGVDKIRVNDVGELGQQIVHAAAQEMHQRNINVRTVKAIDSAGQIQTYGPKDAEYLEDRIEMAYNGLMSKK